MILLSTAWAQGFDGAGIVVSNIDTGTFFKIN